MRAGDHPYLLVPGEKLNSRLSRVLWIGVFAAIMTGP